MEASQSLPSNRRPRWELPTSRQATWQMENWSAGPENFKMASVLIVTKERACKRSPRFSQRSKRKRKVKSPRSKVNLKGINLRLKVSETFRFKKTKRCLRTLTSITLELSILSLENQTNNQWKSRRSLKSNRALKRLVIIFNSLPTRCKTTL